MNLVDLLKVCVTIAFVWVEWRAGRWLDHYPYSGRLMAAIVGLVAILKALSYFHTVAHHIVYFVHINTV